VEFEWDERKARERVIWASESMSEMCASLHHLFHRLPVFGFPYEETEIPLNGVYILFEAGEIAHGTNRIVRVGTHTGDDNLRSRLKEHFITENKDRSIFRKNIGRALLNRDQDPFLAQWELDLTSSEAQRKFGSSVNRAKQSEVERRVTDRIQRNFHFVVFRVDEKEVRRDLEAKIISTVSVCRECGPSQEWLGLYSPATKIRRSGLWLIQKLCGTPLSDSYFADLERLVAS
jgi:hypothetical protein